MTVDKTQIRNASTVIVLRDRATKPRILMGQRGAKAVFMPNKFVFPGGAVDVGDGAVALGTPLPDLCHPIGSTLRPLDTRQVRRAFNLSFAHSRPLGAHAVLTQGSFWSTLKN